MADIIKTWPRKVDRKKVMQVFGHEFARFYFSLGRGKPRQPIERIFFTHRGEILGAFTVESILQNDGTLPKLRSLENRTSEWQFKPDVWVLVCIPPIVWVGGRKLFFGSFRGWRYFQLDEYRKTTESRVNMEE